MNEDSKTFADFLGDIYGFIFVKLGQAGDRSNISLWRLQNYGERIPEYVFLAVGANDFLLQFSALEFSGNMNKIVSILEQDSKKIVILMFFNQKMLEIWGEAELQLLEKYQDVYKQLESHPKVFILNDIWGEVFNNPEFMLDTTPTLLEIY